jgi:exo-beta-1,3-glucanase (GH17 family)
MRRISVATLVVLALSVVFSNATRASEQQPLTTLVVRDCAKGSAACSDRVITINNSPKGLSYTVKTQDGTVLDAQLSDAQLQAKYPEVYDNVRPAMAGSEKTGGTMIWGGTQHVPSHGLPK